jgi:hypothetical protein
MASDATSVRVLLQAGGYCPIPVIGKVPALQAWQKHHQTNPAEIQLWRKLYPDATNTGILTAHNPTIDADLLNEEAAEAVEGLFREYLTSAASTTVSSHSDACAEVRGADCGKCFGHGLRLIAFSGECSWQPMQIIAQQSQSIVTEFGVEPSAVAPELNASPGKAKLATKQDCVDAPTDDWAFLSSAARRNRTEGLGGCGPRVARQRQPGRKHRARARTARRAVSPKTIRDAHGRSRRAPRSAASMPVLRRPHDRHRDLRTRLRAEAQAYAGSGGDQDRHLMMPSPSIDDHLRQLRRFSSDGAHARGATSDRPATAPSTLTADLATPRSNHHPTPYCSAKRSSMPLQSRTRSPNLTAKSP